MKYINHVVKIEIDEEKCTGCGICLQVCPHGVFVIEKGKVHFDDKDRCIECGACDRNCPVNAIKVEAGVG